MMHDAATKSYGMDGVSLLNQLCYFNVATMTMPDMMHLTSGTIQRHFLYLLSSFRLKNQLRQLKADTDPAKVLGQELLNARAEAKKAKKATEKVRAENNRENDRSVAIHRARGERQDRLIVAASARDDKAEKKEMETKSKQAAAKRKADARLAVLEREKCQVSDES